MTGQELTQLALSRLAGDSASELVRVLRLFEVSDSQHLAKNVERWRDGKHEPPAWFALRALAALGMLRDEPAEKGEAARHPESWEHPHLDPLEELRAGVAEVAQSQVGSADREQQALQLLAELGIRLQRVEELLERPEEADGTDG